MGVGKRPVVESGVGGPAPDDGSILPSEDEAVQWRHPARPKSQSALRPGADRAFWRAEPHDLAIA